MLCVPERALLRGASAETGDPELDHARSLLTQGPADGRAVPTDIGHPHTGDARSGGCDARRPKARQSQVIEAHTCREAAHALGSDDAHAETACPGEAASAGLGLSLPVRLGGSVGPCLEADARRNAPGHPQPQVELAGRRDGVAGRPRGDEGPNLVPRPEDDAHRDLAALDHDLGLIAAPGPDLSGDGEDAHPVSQRCAPEANAETEIGVPRPGRRQHREGDTRASEADVTGRAAHRPADAAGDAVAATCRCAPPTGGAGACEAIASHELARGFHRSRRGRKADTKCETERDERRSEPWGEPVPLRHPRHHPFGNRAGSESPLALRPHLAIGVLVRGDRPGARTRWRRPRRGRRTSRRGVLVGRWAKPASRVRRRLLGAVKHGQ